MIRDELEGGESIERPRKGALRESCEKRKKSRLAANTTVGITGEDGNTKADVR